MFSLIVTATTPITTVVSSGLIPLIRIEVEPALLALRTAYPVVVSID